MSLIRWRMWVLQLLFLHLLMRMLLVRDVFFVIYEKLNSFYLDFLSSYYFWQKSRWIINLTCHFGGFLEVWELAWVSSSYSYLFLFPWGHQDVSMEVYRVMLKIQTKRFLISFTFFETQVFVVVQGGISVANQQNWSNLLEKLVNVRWIFPEVWPWLV